MMIAPVVFLDPGMMTGTLTYAFAAALLGSVSNPIGAVVGGLIVGIAECAVIALMPYNRQRAQAHLRPAPDRRRCCWSFRRASSDNEQQCASNSKDMTMTNDTLDVRTSNGLAES